MQTEFCTHRVLRAQPHSRPGSLLIIHGLGPTIPTYTAPHMHFPGRVQRLNIRSKTRDSMQTRANGSTHTVLLANAASIHTDLLRHQATPLFSSHSLAHTLGPTHTFMAQSLSWHKAILSWYTRDCIGTHYFSRRRIMSVEAATSHER